MNIRKPVDYTKMYIEIDALMGADLPQMELYCGIGKAVSQRPEKGAAVAAAEYMQERYPDAFGFSPRNLRRMREFYRTYENSPALLGEAMEIGWTQNVVIMESGLSLEEMGWYLRAVRVFGWSKLELVSKITERAHESGSLEESEPSECDGSGCIACADTVKRSALYRNVYLRIAITLPVRIGQVMRWGTEQLHRRRRWWPPAMRPMFAAVHFYRREVIFSR